MVRLLSLLAWLGGVGCALDLSGAPCTDGTHCPRDQYCGADGRCQLGTPAANLARIDINPAAREVPKGATRKLTAIASFAGGSTQDVTALAAWSSSNSLVATVSDANGDKGVLTGVAEGAIEVTAMFNRVAGQANVTVTAPALTAIVLSPKNPIVPKGTSAQLLAEGTYSDQSTRELTSVVWWSSASPAIASISNTFGMRGQLIGLEKGSTEIAATYEGIQGTTVAFVDAPALVSVALTPTQPAIAINTTQQFIATGTYSDTSTGDVSSAVTWASSNPAVASISNASGSKGVAGALSQGGTTITASLGPISGTTVLVATTATLSSIFVTPTNPTRAKGTTEQFIATAGFSDGTSQNVTSQVSWVSSATAIATISNSQDRPGLASASSAGTTTIAATLSGTTGSTQLNVTGATLVSISLSPTNPSIARSTTAPVVATATFSDSSLQDVTGAATWQSSAPTVASVGDTAGTKGLVTGASVGVSSVSATVSGVSGATAVTVTGATLSSLAVTPANPTFGKGTTLPFTAIGTYSDNTTQDLTTAATWVSAAPSLLTLSNATDSKGVATAVAMGTTTVSANVSQMVGSTGATVSGATLSSIVVTPASLTLAKGSTQTVSATATYSDSSSQDVTQQVTWSSSDPGVATISNASGSRGLVTTIDVGTSTLSATLGSVSGTAALNVTSATLASLAVSPASPTLAKGSTLQCAAIGSYSDGSTQDLTSQASWTSSATSVATISNAPTSRGLATALSVGGTTVAASFGGLLGSTPMTVTNATLVSIVLSPGNPTVPGGGIQQFVATGNYSDGSSQPLTSQVTWSSSNTGVATISNATNSKGRASAVAAGTTSIVAVLFAASGQTSITVSP